jgi:pimeloyl-ACP methyl ester carboxylesterase
MADPTFLFLHAFPLSGAMWDAQVAAFGDRYRVMTPDLCGFGATPPERDPAMSLAGQAGHVLDVVADAGVEDFVLCGSSMGGYIAFEIWRQAPSRVRALVLTNTRAAADTPAIAAARLEQADAVRERGAAAIADALLPKFFAPATIDRAPQLVARLRAMMEATPVDGVLAGLEALRTRRDHREVLGALSCPTLVVLGEDDAIVSPAEMRAMAAAIPGAETASIAAAGHMAPLEQPAIWNDAVAAFLAGAGVP